MLKARTSLLLSSIFIAGMTSCLQNAQAQQSVVNDLTPGVRDTAAITVVQKSLAAMGGVSAIAAVQSLETTGQILKTGSTTPMSFHWEEMVSGSHFEFRRETTMNGTTRVFASGHGKPGFGISGNPAIRLNAHMVIAAVPLALPAIVLYAEFQDPTYAFASIASSGTSQLVHVRITNNSNIFMKAIAQQDWYFDPQTALPVRVEYNLPDNNNALNIIRASCVYSNYTVEEGVQYPSSIQAFEQDRQVSQVTISSIQPNAAINSSDFDVPLEALRTQGANQ